MSPWDTCSRYSLLFSHFDRTMPKFHSSTPIHNLGALDLAQQENPPARRALETRPFLSVYHRALRVLRSECTSALKPTTSPTATERLWAGRGIPRCFLR